MGEATSPSLEKASASGGAHESESGSSVDDYDQYETKVDSVSEVTCSSDSAEAHAQNSYPPAAQDLYLQCQEDELNVYDLLEFISFYQGTQRLPIPAARDLYRECKRGELNVYDLLEHVTRYQYAKQQQQQQAQRRAFYASRFCVSAWLKQIGWSEYDDLFKCGGWDRLECLWELTDYHLISMGIPVGHRVLILKHLHALKCSFAKSQSSHTSKSSWL